MIQLDLLAKIQNRVFRHNYQTFFVVNQTKKFEVTMVGGKRMSIIQSKRPDVIHRFAPIVVLNI